MAFCTSCGATVQGAFCQQCGTPQSATAAQPAAPQAIDRKSTRLNSSHLGISYAVFCLNETAPTDIYTLSLPDALPISPRFRALFVNNAARRRAQLRLNRRHRRQ